MKKMLLAAIAAFSFAIPAVAQANVGFSLEIGSPRSQDYRGYHNRYRGYEQDRRFVYYNGQRYRLVPRRYYCPEDTSPVRVDYRGFICLTDDYDYDHDRGNHGYRNR